MLYHCTDAEHDNKTVGGFLLSTAGSKLKLTLGSCPNNPLKKREREKERERERAKTIHRFKIMWVRIPSPCQNTHSAP